MRETLFASPEGRMLGMGLALTGLMLLAFGIGWHLYPDHILPYAIMTGRRECPSAMRAGSVMPRWCPSTS